MDSIERYQIQSQIGRGGMGIVYRALDPRFNRQVAIKMLPVEVHADSTFRSRFEREARTVAQLGHSAIVPVFDFGEHENQPYLVMAYMGGGSLAERIEQQGQLEADEALEVLRRIASALDVAHQRNIIHRDVKPANILFSDVGECFLTDFGIVKLTEDSAQLTGKNIVGTPHYMAPDMLEEGGLTPLVDVYALAVTLYEMLTGDKPFRADTPTSVVYAHLAKPIPDIREARPDLPKAVTGVLRKGMAKQREERYQSATELATAFATALTGDPIPNVQQPILDDGTTQAVNFQDVQSPIEPEQPLPPPFARPKPSGPPPIVVGLGAIIALVLVAGLIAALVVVPAVSRSNPFGGAQIEITETPSGSGASSSSGVEEPPPTLTPTPTIGEPIIPDQVDGAVIVTGSSTVFPLSQAVADRLTSQAPAIQIDVSSVGSGAGIGAFCDGAADIAASSRLIRDSEAATCTQNGVEFIELPVGHQALAIIVEPQISDVTCLTPSGIDTLFGETSTLNLWSEYLPGQPDEPITYVMLDESTSEYDLMLEAVGEATGGVPFSLRPAQENTSLTNDPAVLQQAISETPYSVGFLSLVDHLNLPTAASVASLRVANEGDAPCIEPSYETVQDGSYEALSRPLYLYVNIASLNNLAVSGYVLSYLEGGPSLAESLGYVPPSEDVQLQNIDKVLPLIPPIE